MNPSNEAERAERQDQDPEPVYLFGPPEQEPAPSVAVEPVVAPQPPRSRRPVRRTVLVALTVTAVMAAAGALLGLLWSWVSPGVPVVNAGANGIVVNDPSPEEYIAADGWFTLITFAWGILAAIAAWFVWRRDRGPGLLVGVVLGGLASSAVAWGVGRLIGLSAWHEWESSSTVGQTYTQPPDLHTRGALLVAAFGAVIVMTLLAGWSNDPDLDLPGALPGYGPNNEAAPSDEAAPGNTAAPRDEAAPGNTAAPSDEAAPGSEAGGENGAKPGAGTPGGVPTRASGDAG